MYGAIFRIFFLLFLPISFWIIYSWSLQTFQIASVELPKMDKIELLRLSPTSSKSTFELPPQPKPIKKVLSVSAVLDKNISNTKPKTPITKKYKTKVTPIIAGNMRLFILGDSMGEGVTLGLGEMKKKYPIDFMSIAKCSTTTHYWLGYSGLEEKILAYKPTIILIVLGTNEWNGVGSSTKLRILKIHNRLEKLGIKTLWITPPVAKSTQFYEMVHDVYGERVYDSRFLDVPRGRDHIHPTMQGYIRWTSDILASLNIKKGQ
jgi:hypothetical protein